MMLLSVLKFRLNIFLKKMTKIIEQIINIEFIITLIEVKKFKNKIENP